MFPENKKESWTLFSRLKTKPRQNRQNLPILGVGKQLFGKPSLFFSSRATKMKVAKQSTMKWTSHEECSWRSATQPGFVAQNVLFKWGLLASPSYSSQRFFPLCACGAFLSFLYLPLRKQGDTSLAQSKNFFKAKPHDVCLRKTPLSSTCSFSSYSWPDSYSSSSSLAESSSGLSCLWGCPNKNKMCNFFFSALQRIMLLWRTHAGRTDLDDLVAHVTYVPLWWEVLT